MTIVIDSDQASAERVTAYLYKLVNVLQVEDLGNVPAAVAMNVAEYIHEQEIRSFRTGV